MGYANATGPSVRHTITLSPRLTAAVEAYCAERGIPVSAAVRLGLARLLGDKSLAEMPGRGQPRKGPENEGETTISDNRK